MGSYTALYDACVLYPAPLRDLLIRLGRTGLFRAKWTADIHEEWIRNLVAAGRDRARLERTRDLMDRSIPDCLVTGYQPLIESLKLPDSDDRHVLAAAIICAADVIVTSNVQDFPAEVLRLYDIEAQHPDEFIVCQFDLSPSAVCQAVKEQRANLRNPAYTVDEFLSILARQQLPMTVALGLSRTIPCTHHTCCEVSGSLAALGAAVLGGSEGAAETAAATEERRVGGDPSMGFFPPARARTRPINQSGPHHRKPLRK